MTETEKKIEKMLSMPKEKRSFEIIYNESRYNPNNVPCWLPKLAPHFATPKTVLYDVPFKQFLWLISDDYNREEVEDFGKSIVKAIKDGFGENPKLPLFLKGYTFSNKFTFSDCIIRSLDPLKVGQQALNIAYSAMCVGATYQAGFAIREFIDPKCNLPKIYGGMPLHTEFRAFYNFDTKNLLAVYPYWDKETMLTNLRGFDRDTFADYANVLDGKFTNSIVEVTKLAEHQLRLVDGLLGIWSVDFMKDVSGKVWLIDAAVGNQSYYYERLGIKE